MVTYLKGLAVVALVALMTALSYGPSLPFTGSITPDDNLKVVEDVLTPEQEFELKWKELTYEEKVEWNPNDCDLAKEILWSSDGTCHPKPRVDTRKSYQAGDCGRYLDLVSKYSWDVRVAMAIMQAESGCNPNAANWADNHGVCMGSFGLFQISCHGGEVYDPAENIKIAWAKYQARGWYPWGAYTNGSYLRYLQ